jgi:hypothetical protein
MAKAKKRGTRTQPTKRERPPYQHPSGKLLSEMTQEEVDRLSEDDFDDLLDQQIMHNIRTHTPHGSFSS